MMQLDKPNLSIPLAVSYNARNVKAYTGTVTNGVDQRKVNCFYELIRNSVTGKPTLYLAKRPGVTATTPAGYGTATQTAYLVVKSPENTSLQKVWVLANQGSGPVAIDSVGTTTNIPTSSGPTTKPRFVSETNISGTNFVVVQTSGGEVSYSSTIGTFTQITDGDFTALSVKGGMEHMDGFAFVLDSKSRIYNSDINSLANWTANNYITKSVTQDNPLGLAKFKHQILAFGRESVEVFVNAGNGTGSQLQSVKEIASNVGMALADPITAPYYAVVGGRMYFYGCEGGVNGGGAFAYNGATFAKVSTTAIDRILWEVYQANGYPICAVTFNGNEAVAFSLSLQGATTQRWLMFFPAWNEWFEWSSTVFSPQNAGQVHLGVGTNLNNLTYYFSSADTYTDNSGAYTMTVQFKLPSDGNQRKRMPMCGVVGDTARSASTLNVQFSDDDYQTTQTARGIDMTQVTKKHIYRCGAFTDRAVTLTHTGSLECRLDKFIARIE